MGERIKKKNGRSAMHRPKSDVLSKAYIFFSKIGNKPQLIDESDRNMI
ncbi:MAG: hypothetical protein IJX91_00025 [Clostridia bacterium]|nr:hypothetical protein [Clostridia bacterium]